MQPKDAVDPQKQDGVCCEKMQQSIHWQNLELLLLKITFPDKKQNSLSMMLVKRKLVTSC